MTHPMRTEHAIVYAANAPHNRRSAVTFAGSHALVSVSVLIGALSVRTGRQLADNLLHDRFVNGANGDWSELRSLEFRLLQSTEQRAHRTRNARLVCVFNCRPIGDSVLRLLDGFEATSSAAAGGSDEFQLARFALSAFVVLETALDAGGPSSTPERALLGVRRTLEAALVPDGSDTLRFRAVNRLDRVASVTTPFTNVAFFGSVHLGRVANVFGDDDCLFVISQPLAAGCDGGAVYNERLELAGIVVSTAFRWRNTENATLTLVAHVANVVEAFLQQSGDALGAQRSLRVQRHGIRPVDSPRIAKYIRSIVLIQAGTSSGSGCLVRIGSQRYLLTCSHVVANARAEIQCTWQRGSFRSRIVYRNPRPGSAYDVALLSVADDVPDEHFAGMHGQRPLRVGQRVYAAGFPHFVALAHEPFAPSVYAGRVTQSSAHMLLTDASIQAGQSGGPLLNDAGQVVGVMVSNTRQANGHIHPNVNMCVPAVAIAAILERFARTQDVRVLDELEAVDSVVRSWNLQDDLILSKL